MFEADDHFPAEPHGQPVEFRVPAQLESLAVVRALVAALGTLEDLDLDAVADLRLALDEACTALIRCAVPESVLTVVVRPREQDLWVAVSAPCTGEDVLRPG
ncbi:MAG: anti-sigma factor, partial [Mycobacteriaceae bacterium]|nr:anti-sigma factor [Mycobacteriaceae bacterium]